MTAPKIPEQKRSRSRQKADAPVSEATAPVQPKPGPAAHLAGFQFKPGQSGNPNGRPKGSRNKLSEAFVEALFEDFEEACEQGGKTNGKIAIATVRKEDPSTYLRVIAALAPKQVHIKEDVLDAFEEDELSAAMAAIAAIRKTRGDGSQDRGEAPTACGAKPH